MPLERLTPMLNVRDLEATVAWYQGVGFELVDAVEHEGVRNWALLVRDGASLMINLREATPEGAAAGVDLYFRVDDIDALWAELGGRPEVCEPLQERFYGVRDFWMADCNGTMLGFGQPLDAQ